MGSVMVDGGFVKNAVVSAGSHFATAERQYRYPLELGNQRPPASQWTVTGDGSCALSAGGDPQPSDVRNGLTDKISSSAPKALGCGGHPRITHATFGKVIDWGVIDVNNMGAAMAPAAAATLVAHFLDTKRTPNDYDAIFSGDLGKVGEEILRDIMKDEGFTLGANYNDCGRIIYCEEQNLYQGGSGCGCSAVVLNSFIMQKLRTGEYKRILFLATGALLSPVSSFQGNSIPGIAHAVVIES
jgi:stage V sporulation protein AD